LLLGSRSVLLLVMLMRLRPTPTLQCSLACWVPTSCPGSPGCPWTSLTPTPSDQLLGGQQR